MKYLFALAAALTLGACTTHSTSSTADNNTVTVTTANEQVVVDDQAKPITARQAVKDARTE